MTSSCRPRSICICSTPDIADQIPDGALVVFVPVFDKELARRNRALARESRAPGQSVVYVEIDRMVASRLQGLTLTLARVRSGERCHRPG